MPWLRSGDNAATYPALLAVASLEAADERLLNEVAGFVWRCASQSAGHLTDGVIDVGTASLMGGPRWRGLLDAAAAAGLVSATTVEGRPAWRLVQDQEFLHIRDKEGVLWERQRDRDRRSPELTMPVRHRDGDACRYCGVVVDFSARKGTRSGTYDHADPGRPASVDTYVVCCRGCNSKMRDGERLPLLAPPAQPYYTAKTVAMLDEHGLTPTPGNYRSEPARASEDLTEGGHRRAPARPAPAGDTAPASDPDPAPQRATRTPQAPATSGPPSWAVDQADPGHNPWEALPDDDLAEDPDPIQNVRVAAGRDGTGRDGQGRGGPGRGGAGVSPPAGGRGRSGRRRGRRGKGKGGGGR